jgi:hypothetical protein
LDRDNSDFAPGINGLHCSKETDRQVAASLTAQCYASRMSLGQARLIVCA